MGYLIVFLGAGIGGAARHGVNTLALLLLGAGFPWATLAINVMGSLVMGILTGSFIHRGDPGLSWRLFLTTGILGGFTTFSTFSLDAVSLAQKGHMPLAILYVVASVGLGLAGLLAGLAFSRL